MRRSLFGLLTVVAIAGLLLVPGCQVFQQSGTLNVLSINGGNTLRVDLLDYYKYFNKDDSEWVTLVQVNPDSVKVELQYAEIGAGLPTWRPYEALLKQVTVHFTSQHLTDNEVSYQDAKVQLAEAVPSDPAGKKITSLWITPISATWLATVFADYLGPEDDPDYIDLIDVADAKFTFSGYDSVADRDVSAASTIQVEFGNFYDDPTRFGK
jgi:hypothetical protein